MDRRDFLKKALLSAGAVVSTSVLPATAGRRSEKCSTRLETLGYVREPARDIPVIASADVVVVGGGPSGVAAAVMAARNGASVVLVERNGFLGGLWTGGLVIPVLATRGLGRSGETVQAVEGFSREICNRLFDMGMCINPSNNPRPDPQAAMYVLDRMIEEAGVRMVYYAQASALVMSGERIDSVILDTKSGRVAVKGKYFIDGSGDGDLIEWAGEQFREMKYQIGIMHRIGNTDRVDATKEGYVKQKLGSKTPIPGVNLRHLVGEKDQDGLDLWNITRLQMKYRKQIWEEVEQIRRVPGHEEIYLVNLAELLGVRVTRVLDAVHNVTLDESMRRTHYVDRIGMSGACDPDLWWQGRKILKKERPVWQIPYSALTPKRCPNLLTAGRCFGFDRGIAYDAREIGTCFVTGQAAGTAAALAALERTSVREVSIQKLQSVLRSQNAKLEE